MMNGTAVVPRFFASKYIQMLTRVSSINRSTIAAVLVRLSNGKVNAALPSRMNAATAREANPSHAIPTRVCFQFIQITSFFSIYLESRCQLDSKPSRQPANAEPLAPGRGDLVAEILVIGQIFAVEAQLIPVIARGKGRIGIK